jgi:hemoglobin
MELKNRPGADENVVVGKLVFTFDDIFHVVGHFYGQVQLDDLLKVPFASVHDWTEHVDRLTNFWWIRFGGKPFLFSEYNPVAKHFFAGFNKILLDRWLQLFHDTLKLKLTPQQATIWTEISILMGQGLTAKNEMFKRQHYDSK